MLLLVKTNDYLWRGTYYKRLDKGKYFKTFKRVEFFSIGI